MEEGTCEQQMWGKCLGGRSADPAAQRRVRHEVSFNGIR